MICQLPLCRICKQAFSLKPSNQISVDCYHCRRIRAIKATMTEDEKRFVSQPFIDLKHGESAWLPSP